ncbi:hypothetical protein Gotri_012838 [Gossypium trilobum]|uniref:Uncharacterized protein n=1 Tax=Gossypium trilobum TaxID=34281 RepID=A0A7J9DRK4_9ROSI|nr:hypothetical protein [Gossypium trilobum]
MTKAQYLLQQKTYSLWTDGRRILAYDMKTLRMIETKNPCNY